MKNRFLFNQALRILIITNALVLVAGAMFGPITALFVEKVGGDLLDASLAGTIFALAAGLTVLVSGRYSDQARYTKRIMILGYFLIGLGFLLYTVVNSVGSLLLVQLVIGFGEAIYAPAFDVLYTHHMAKHKAGQVWGTWEATNYFSLAVGATAGGLIATYFGFTALFIVMALLAFGSSLYIYLLPEIILKQV